MPESARPALLGGVAVRPQGPPEWPLPDRDVQAALAEAGLSGAWGRYHGEHVSALESELALFHVVPHALSCSSGTLAVEVALRALRVAPGDEVIMSAYDYESNFLTVHALGAKPVLIDVDPLSWQMDHTQLETARTPQTKAVICSHLHGGTVAMREVTELASRYGIAVVEDAAQATGAMIQGKPAGTWGDIGTLSFGGSKLLTAGRGGALLFKDSQLLQRAKLWLQRGIQQWAPLSELQAAVLRPQLAKLREKTLQRWANVQQLTKELQNPEHTNAAHLECFKSISCGLNCFPTRSNTVPAFYKLGFRYDPVAFGLSRERFVAAMRAEGIAFDVGFKALHIGRSPSRYLASGSLENATTAHDQCVILHHPVLSLTEREVAQVAEAVAKTYRYRRLF